MTARHLCPGCEHPLSQLTVYELWCANCMRSWENPDQDENLAELAAQAREERDPDPYDADRAEDAYQRWLSDHG